MRYVEAPLGEGEGGVVGSLDQRSQVYREFSSALTTLDRAENPVTPWILNMRVLMIDKRNELYY